MNEKKDFIIPKPILRQFEREPRIVMFYRPDGLWPVPIDILKKSEYFNELFADKHFAENYQVVIMQK